MLFDDRINLFLLLIVYTRPSLEKYVFDISGSFSTDQLQLGKGNRGGEVGKLSYSYMASSAMALSTGSGDSHFSARYLNKLLALNTAQSAIKSSPNKSPSSTSLFLDILGDTLYSLLERYDRYAQESLKTFMDRYEDVLEKHNPGVIDIDSSSDNNDNTGVGNDLKRSKVKADNSGYESTDKANSTPDTAKLRRMELSVRALYFAGAADITGCFIKNADDPKPVLHVTHIGNSVFSQFSKYDFGDKHKFLYLPGYTAGNTQNNFKEAPKLKSNILYDIKAELSRCGKATSDPKLIRHMLKLKLADMAQEFEVPVEPADIILVASRRLHDILPAPLLSVFVNYVLYSLEQYEIGFLSEFNPSKLLHALIDDFYDFAKGKTDTAMRDMLLVQKAKRAVELSELSMLEEETSKHDKKCWDVAMYFKVINTFKPTSKYVLDKDMDSDEALARLVAKKRHVDMIDAEQYKDQILLPKSEEEALNLYLKRNAPLLTDRAMDVMLTERREVFEADRTPYEQLKRVHELYQLFPTRFRPKPISQTDEYLHIQNHVDTYEQLFQAIENELKKGGFSPAEEDTFTKRVPVETAEIVKKRKDKKLKDISVMLNGIQSTTVTDNGSYKASKDGDSSAFNDRVRGSQLAYNNKQGGNKISDAVDSSSKRSVPVDLDLINILNSQMNAGVTIKHIDDNKLVYQKGRFTVTMDTPPELRNKIKQPDVEVADSNISNKPYIEANTHQNSQGKDLDYKQPHQSETHEYIEGNALDTKDNSFYSSASEANSLDDIETSYDALDSDEPRHVNVFEAAGCELRDYFDYPAEGDTPGVNQVKVTSCVFNLLKEYAIGDNYLSHYGHHIIGDALASAAEYAGTKKPIGLTSLQINSLIFGRKDLRETPGEASVIAAMLTKSKARDAPKPREQLKDISNEIQQTFKPLKGHMEEYLKDSILK